MCMKHAVRMFSMCIHGMFIQLLMWPMWTMLYELWVLTCRHCQQISLFLWVKWQWWYSVSNKTLIPPHSLLPSPPPLFLSFPLSSTYTQPVQPCSPNFPLTNYTLNIDGAVSRVVAPGDVVAGVPVTLSGLERQDSSFSLTVTACNDVTCRTSTPRTISKQLK